METLAYLHLALANEAPTDPDYRDLTSSWESLKQLSRGAINQVWNQPQFSTSAAASLLSLSIALGILGMANQASAAFQEGDRGAEVTAVQQRLQELGYFKANITGYFDPLTKDAVIQFQRAKGLEPDGIVGRNTLVALGGKSKTGSQRVRSRILQALPSPQSVRESSRRILQLGDRGSQVSALQESLEAAGFPSGADGIFDEATQKAVIRFQQAKGLAPDGMVGPQTLAALPAIGGPNPSSVRRNSSSRSTPRTTTNRSTTRDTTNRSTPRTTTNRSTPRTTSDRSTRRTTSDRSTTRDTSSRSTPSNTSNRSTPRTTTSRLNTPTSNTPSSSATEALQKRLQELGFYRGEIDGIWGPQTQAAVEAAQRSYDVSVSDLEKNRI
ncbi:peptidoglycan-binding protein [Allocoleopsis sp.]|uniref:peptidoglycan-binding protein n=1 Tax=Allocoleopsis sp. TaxID=3088169 RepID=UPI002FD03316